MTIRLSIISLAGMARTLVAVGTSSDADMFFTTAAAAPRSTWTSSPSAGAGRRLGAAFGLAGLPVRAFAGSGALAGAATPLPAAAFGAGAGAGSGGASVRGRGRLGRLPIAGGGVAASVVGSGE